MLHCTIREVSHDVDRMAFNTAIARMMEFTNFFTKQATRPHSAMERFVLLLSPFAPHIAEELWQVLGQDTSLAYEPWPTYDEEAIKQDSVEVVVQINGKVRSKITVGADADREQTEQAARSDSRIIELLAGKRIVKAVAVPGRLVNFVVRG